MVTANLTVTAELEAALALATAEDAPRAIEVVVDPAALTLSPGQITAATESSVEDDYAASIAPECAEGSAPRIWLLRLSPTAWSSVLFVPDDAAVRLKLLFASSLQQVRELLAKHVTLEAGGFRASDSSEASASAFAAWRNREHGSRELMTDAEKIRAALAAEELAEAAAASSAAPAAPRGGIVPFRVSDELIPALRRFADGSAAVLVVRLDLEKEEMGCAAESAEPGAPFVEEAVAAGGPCFLLLSRAALLALAPPDAAPPAPATGSPPGCALVYFCPDDAPVRARMTNSTAKSTLVQQAKYEAGVEAAAALEVGSVAELREDVARMLAEQAEAAAAAGQVSLATGAAAPSASFAKPSRPGRRRK
ncbi:hypothetical protein FNF27_02352 [Cafeteria roenbergensis]|uniref:ADF-H domain-containing protein n=2 Tax=Cafeteria roenbergensis TaxID=33653 RepID=A0A5A8C5B4_CAFRO|nr:hypothetical protein FNF29_06959 [Cafeteria roenbergensis]KAA0176296.1 hypothetical protein FNF27_02352 [Cafeteria roenbergensis]|eukprot:KAA0148015.1 hypothetical protein FNF29_06959 [Cafeteria roenbergensis]